MHDQVSAKDATNVERAFGEVALAAYGHFKKIKAQQEREYAHLGPGSPAQRSPRHRVIARCGRRASYLNELRRVTDSPKAPVSLKLI
jgi:hypothetical protein